MTEIKGSPIPPPCGLEVVYPEAEGEGFPDIKLPTDRQAMLNVLAEMEQDLRDEAVTAAEAIRRVRMLFVDLDED